MAHWDKLYAEFPSISEEVDVCWYWLPNVEIVKAAPNSRRFILRPTEHARKYHFSPDIPTHSSTHSTLDSFVTSKKNTLVSIDGDLSTKNNCTVTSQDKTRTITVKNNIKLRYCFPLGPQNFNHS